VHEASLGGDRDEVGLGVSAVVSLGAFGVRVQAVSRMPLAGSEGGDAPAGLTVQGAVSASH
jgi:hypothetical protein